MFRLTEKKKWRTGGTAFLLMLFSFIVILLPVGLLINMLSSKVTYAIQHSAELMDALKKVVGSIEQQYKITIASDANINKLGNVIAQSLPKILGATFNTLTIIIFMYFILYFMLVNGRKMEDSLFEHIPLRDENVLKLGKEVHTMVISNAIGIPLIAFAQGLGGINWLSDNRCKRAFLLVWRYLYSGDAPGYRGGSGLYSISYYLFCQ